MKVSAFLAMGLVLIALVLVFYFSNRSDPPTQQEPPRYFVWTVDALELQHITISLPREGKQESWFKDTDKLWYFDKPDGSKVDNRRWGGGIPLLLSGPGANRLVVEEAATEQLEMYGLDFPKMYIELLMENKNALNVVVGDSTLDGTSYYIKRTDDPRVFTVDYTWYEVLEGLVMDPPHLKSD